MCHLIWLEMILKKLCINLFEQTNESFLKCFIIWLWNKIISCFIFHFVQYSFGCLVDQQIGTSFINLNDVILI